MIRTIYYRLPGPPAARLAALSLAALVILVLVIWSYEVLGDFLDSGGSVGE
jgi:hypothetical protein